MVAKTTQAGKELSDCEEPDVVQAWEKSAQARKRAGKGRRTSTSPEVKADESDDSREVLSGLKIN